MKKVVKKFIFYLIYISFAMILSTTSVLAVPGKCIVKEGGVARYVGTVEGEAPCTCPCEPVDRDSTGMYCHRCGHFMIPTKPVVEEGAAARAAALKPFGGPSRKDAVPLKNPRHPFSVAAQEAKAAEAAKGPKSK